jgi:hypothetical protein
LGDDGKNDGLCLCLIKYCAKRQSFSAIKYEIYYLKEKKQTYFIIFYLHDNIAPKSSSIVVGNVL